RCPPRCEEHLQQANAARQDVRRSSPPLCRSRYQRGHPALRRVDDNGRPYLAIHDVESGTRIEPAAVVTAHVACRTRRSVAALRRRGTIAFDGFVALLLERNS